MGSQLAIDAPLKCSSQFRAIRLLGSRTPAPPLSLATPLATPPSPDGECRSSLSERRQVGHTVACSNHDRRHPLQGYK